MTTPRSPIIAVIDNFLPTDVFKAIRAEAEHAPTQELYIPGDKTYQGITLTDEAGHLLASYMGEPYAAMQHTAAFRTYNKADSQPNHIHCDIGFGLYTAILYLTDSPGCGTAFYKHKMTGETGLYALTKEPTPMSFWNGDHFDQTEVVEHLPNRLVVFYAGGFHARIPEIYIAERERRILIAFFGTPPVFSRGLA